MEIYNIEGNTYYFKTEGADIPFYKLNDKEIILLDSGLNLEAKKVQDVLSKYNLTVRAIICTHAHVDNVGNNSWLQEKYGAQVIMPEYESMICENEYNLNAYLLNGNFRNMEKRYKSMVFKTDRKIKTDETFVCVDGHKFEIVKLYGHTFYHVGIITPDDVFYVGDALISEENIKMMKLPYMTDIGLALKTINKIKSIKCSKYILAHNGVYDEIGYITYLNIKNIEKRVKIIFDLITKPMTMSEILKEGYKIFEISNNIKSYILTERILTSYLNYLLYNGVVKLEIIDNCLKYLPSEYNSL